MPAIRNAILMVLANKSSQGAARAARARSSSPHEIMREAVRPMGIEVAAPEPITLAAGASRWRSAAMPALGRRAAPRQRQRRSEPSGDRRCAARSRSRARRAEGQRNPIQHVHFSSFIIQ